MKSDSMKEKLRKLEEKAELFHKMQRGVSITELMRNRGSGD